MSIVKRCVAEFIGTFWLVFGGCGSAVFAAAFPEASNALGIAAGFLYTYLFQEPTLTDAP